uniref:Uncharacterized protein n=1 Tax=Panagrolaimus sp. ES5 TaxID=591445 RepID=A0AC34FBP1_9BILA
MLILYIFVLVGVSKERPGYLVPAEIIMGIVVALSVILIIALIIIGIALPAGIVSDFQGDDVTLDDAKTAVRVAFFLLAFFILCANSHNIFAFIVIRRCRKWLSENGAHTHPHGIVYGAGPQPTVHVYHSGPPPPQQPYGAQGYPQQYYSGPPPQQAPYPQAYHPSPQPSPQPGYHA